MDKMSEVPHIDMNDPYDMPDGHWIDNRGFEVWIKDGKYHRADGPAVITDCGAMVWCMHGKHHRTDGPAVLQDAAPPYWCLWGSAYSLEDWLVINTYITEKQKLFLKLKYG